MARFHTEEEVVEYYQTAKDNPGPSSGEDTKGHCVVEFERGTDKCKILAEFDTSKQATDYRESIQNKYKPFGPFFVQVLELRPGGDYDDLNRKPPSRKPPSRQKAK
ncbi:MAG: hypothetical protein JW860_04300 [Sedimentisphaerales bacterium]|nr:hypothetical protein [Sedimentisphaerales bacterium]